jgi:hypothetical protein
VGNPLIDVLVVLFALIAGVLVAGVLRNGRSPYNDIGAGSLSFQHEDEDAEASEVASRHARAEELRQMLQARSERLVRSGEPPLDVEAELAKLEASHAGDDPGIGV